MTYQNKTASKPPFKAGDMLRIKNRDVLYFERSSKTLWVEVEDVFTVIFVDGSRFVDVHCWRLDDQARGCALDYWEVVDASTDG